MKDERYPKWLKWLVACATAYGLLPVDLIPDIIPILGLADDAVLLAAVAFLLVARFLAAPRWIPEPARARRR